jgi:hypothetical protein
MEQVLEEWFRRITRDDYFPRPERDFTWRIIKATFMLGRKLPMLLQLTSTENSETDVRPLPGGSNLEDQDLRFSWVLHRAWIRLLHYRSLYF